MTRAEAEARLLPLLEAYATGLADKRYLWRNVCALRCELAESGSGEPGDAGTPPCYLASPDATEWCATCRKRDPIFQAYRDRKRANRKLLAGVERLAARLLVPDPVDPPPVPGPLIEMMATEPVERGGI